MRAKEDRTGKLAPSLLLALVVAGCGAGHDSLHCDDAEATSLEALAARFEAEIHPLLMRPATEGGCAECHAPATTHRFVVFHDPRRTLDELWGQGYLPAAAEVRTLLGVLQGTGGLRMPLGGASWPEEEIARVEAFLCALEASGLDAPALCAGDPDPGNTLIRRLSNFEYDQTVRDLTGENGRPGLGLPADPAAHGFDNVSSAQQISPAHIESYQEAARRIARDTLLVPEPIGLHFEAELLSAFANSGAPHHSGWGGPTPSAAPEFFRFRRMNAYVTSGLKLFPYDGTYTIRVRARGKNADYLVHDEVVEVDVPTLMRVTVGGAQVGDLQVVQGDPGYQFGPWQEYTFTAHFPAGTHTVRAGIANATWGAVHKRDVQLDVDWFVVSGPEPAELPAPDLERIARFLVCDESEPGCLDDAVAGALGRLWRRPATAAEVARYAALVSETIAEGDGFKDGIELVLEAALLSPNFLLRPEVPPDAAGPGPLEPYELATRLSYFVWSSAPDAELLALAEDGSLADDAVLEAEIDRMLADPRSAALTDNFAAQWLNLRQMETMAPSYEVFPEFDDELREAMIGEIRHLFAAFLDEDRSLLDILDADFTYLNQTLAAHYGIALPGAGPAFQRVDATGSLRGGLITSAGFLTLTSHPAKTSPTLRGKWILDQLLCQPPADPPPDVDTSIEPPSGGGPASVREILEQHRQDPACASCHAAMDAMGLVLESFDPLGRWRLIDDFGTPVDTTSELPSGEVIEDHRGLVAYLKQNAALEACVTQKMIVYALGRDPELIDQCALSDVQQRFAASGHTVRGLVKAIAHSSLFRHQRPANPGEYPTCSACDP